MKRSMITLVSAALLFPLFPATTSAGEITVIRGWNVNGPFVSVSHTGVTERFRAPEPLTISGSSIVVRIPATFADPLGRLTFGGHFECTTRTDENRYQMDKRCRIRMVWGDDLREQSDFCEYPFVATRRGVLYPIDECEDFLLEIERREDLVPGATYSFEIQVRTDADLRIQLHDWWLYYALQDYS